MRIIYRNEWGARGTSGNVLTTTPAMVVFHHWGSPGPARNATTDDELRALKAVEAHHIDTQKWSAIGYNWIVMQSGRVYEGRGWMRQGAHARGVNAQSVGIAFAMDGRRERPTEAALSAAVALVDIGVGGGALVRPVHVSGHRDHAATECPGPQVYALLDDLSKRINSPVRINAPDLPEIPPADVRAPDLPAAARAPAVPITPALVRRELEAEGFDADQIDRIARVLERLHAGAEAAVRWWDRAGPLIRDLVRVWRGVRGR